jgi:hypothetical protein
MLIEKLDLNRAGVLEEITLFCVVKKNNSFCMLSKSTGRIEREKREDPCRKWY